jgi:hypothetical protein
MKPGDVQTVVIYGKPCALQLAPETGGGRVNTYRITDPKTGAVIASQDSRLLAVAKAAEALRTPA